MTIEERIERIVDYLRCDVCTEDVVDWYNVYQSECGCKEYQMHSMDDFNGMYSYLSPLGIIGLIENSCFSSYDDWFFGDEYYVESFDHEGIIDKILENNDFIEYIVERNEDFGDRGLREVLSSEDEGEEE